MAEQSPHKRSRPGVAQQRKIILDAAVELFAGKGSAAHSVAAICRAAGVSRDTYYRCFPDKEALLAALYEESVKQHMDAVMVHPGLDYADQQWLQRVCDDTIDAILAQQDVARFLFIEAADPQSPAAAVIAQAYDKVAVRMQAWYREQHGEPPALAYFKSLLVAVQWLVHTAINDGGGDKAVIEAKQSARQLLYAALNA